MSICAPDCPYCSGEMCARLDGLGCTHDRRERHGYDDDLFLEPSDAQLMPKAMAGKRGGALPAPLTERFWSKVQMSFDHWLWIGALNDSGYGAIWDGTRLVYAHRLAYELLVGPIADGLTIDHLCRVRACVRPDHLEPVPSRVNMERGVASRTSCRNGHPYGPTPAMYRGSRYCVTCRREWVRAHRDVA